MLQTARRIARETFLAALPPTIGQRLQFALKEPSRGRVLASTGDAADDALLAQIQSRGFATIPGYFTPGECNAGIAELETALSQYAGAAHLLDDDRLFGVEHVSSVAARFRDDPRWERLATTYSGEPSASLFIMGNRMEPRGQINGSGGGWHRDCFARELKVMVYLTDVGPDNGPFSIVRRSNGTRSVLADMKTAKLRAVQNRVDHRQVEAIGRVEAITAKAGTAIVFDVSAIHCGAPIKAGKRYALANYLAPRRRMASEAIHHGKALGHGA